MNHLQKAEELLRASAARIHGDMTHREFDTQQALTHAVIALVQRVDQLLEAQALPRYVITPPSDKD